MNGTYMTARRATAHTESWEHRYRPPAGRPNPEWPQRAACATAPTDLFYAAHTAQAIAICESCPVRLQCLQAAYLEEASKPAHLVFGVRGGLRPEQRSAVIKADRRAGRAPVLKPVDHGTEAGYHRCRQRAGKPCQLCTDAHTRYHNPTGAHTGATAAFPHRTISAQLADLELAQ